MRKKIEWEWEKLDESTWRAKVIGGWLVRTEMLNGKTSALSTVFVPDHEHYWTIIPPFNPEAEKKAKAEMNEFAAA